MCENLHGKADSFSGLLFVEADDLLGRGIGFRYQAAIEGLRKECNLGEWKTLMDTSTEYGGLTFKQLLGYLFKICMTRYLKGKATRIKLARGRCKDLKAPADAGEIIEMRELAGKLNLAAREVMPQGAGDASILAFAKPTPKVGDLVEANVAMRRLVHIKYPSGSGLFPWKTLD